MPEIEPQLWKRTIARLEQRLGSSDTHAAVREVILAAVDVFGVAGGGIMLVDEEGILQPLLGTSDAAHHLETVQAELGEGPCVDCLLLDRVITTHDVRADARWPRLPDRLEGQPIGGVLGIPVRLAGGAVGSLNVFQDEPHQWDEGDVESLSAFGRIIETVVATAVLANRQEKMIQHLQAALDQRVEIERAVGLLMGRHELDAVEAFNRLRSSARSSRRRVIEVARELLGPRGGG